MTVLPLLAATGCSSDADDRSQVNDPMPLTFVSQMEGLVEATRSGTALQATKIVSGIKVGIYVYDHRDKVTTAADYATSYKKENVEFTSNGNNGWSNSYTWYWPENGNSINVYAYAPYNSSWKISGTNTFSVGSTQTTDAQYTASDLLSGSAANPVSPGSGTTAPGTVPITFSHKLSKITITLTAGNGMSLNDVTSVQITNTKVKGTVTMASNVISSVAPASDATVTTITCGEAKTSSCSAIIIPQEVAANTKLIRVTTSSGGVYDYPLSAKTTFLAGKEYKYNITLNLYGLTVSSTITNWADPITESKSLSHVNTQ